MAAGKTDDRGWSLADTFNGVDEGAAGGVASIEPAALTVGCAWGRWQRALRRRRGDWERRLAEFAPMIQPESSTVGGALEPGSGRERVLRAAVLLQRAWRWFANEMVENGLWDDDDYSATAEELLAAPVTTSPPFRFLVRARLHAPLRLWPGGVSGQHRDARRWRVGSGSMIG